MKIVCELRCLLTLITLHDRSKRRTNIVLDKLREEGFIQEQLKKFVRRLDWTSVRSLRKKWRSRSRRDCC